MTLNTLPPLIDCNRNGLHDPEEIAANPALDCNADGVLNECELGSQVVEGFDSVSTLPLTDWVNVNNSLPPGPASWGRGNPTAFAAQAGSPDSYAAANFQSTGDNGNGIPDACESAPCLSDINSDTNVNVTDLLALLAAWGSCPSPCPPDINSDGSVNVTDLLALLGDWGPCP